MVCAPPLARPGRPGFQGLHGLVDALQCCVRLCTTMIASSRHPVYPVWCAFTNAHTCSATWHGFNTHSAFGVAGGAEAVYIVVMSCMLYVLCAMSMYVIDYNRLVVTRGRLVAVVSSVTADCARQPARGAWRERITHTTLALDIRHQQQQHAASATAQQRNSISRAVQQQQQQQRAKTQT
eukprot:scaffold22630_cov157-Isochrysis_galbana.AAC.2